MPKQKAGPEFRPYDVGFAKPPRSTQFRKGVSGNPTGRPKGSKNISSILVAMGREKVKGTVNGKVRRISLLELVIRQLSNKAATGDLKAIRELLVAHRIFAEPEQPTEAADGFHERDASVMKNLLERIRGSEYTSASDTKELPKAEEAE
jgi:hypothetical protein